MSADVTLPKIGKVKKIYVWGGVGLAGAYVAWKWYGASGDSGETEYSTDYVSEPLATGGSGAYVGGRDDDDDDDDDDSVISTNSQWTQRAVDLLAAAGYDASSVYAALGDFLNSSPLTTEEQTIVRASLAAAGSPPVGGPYTIITQVGDVTLTAPTGLTSTAQTGTTVTLTWSPVTGASYYRAYRKGVSTNVGGSDATSITVGGLEPNKSYQFAVAADTTTGKTGPKSSYITVKTKGMTLAKPATPTVSGIEKTKAVVTTKAVSGARGYNWYINGIAHGHSDGLKYTVVSLKANTTYRVSVAADSPTTAPGPQSSPKSFKTKK